MKLTDERMTGDDEPPSRNYKKAGQEISTTHIFKCRDQLGWTHCGSTYCQLIRDVNK